RTLRKHPVDVFSERASWRVGIRFKKSVACIEHSRNIFWFVPLANALVVFGCQPSHSTLLVLFKEIICKNRYNKKDKCAAFTNTLI
ncbi:MAG: hypothetical protein ACK5M1_12775, partial [Xanthomarina gelatinilytica]|uniref:hypothetical protein n=1 Tax=Xanthomarina gelatinilytica TaxID=1137281 RepID=UPI003A8BD975